MKALIVLACIVAAIAYRCRLLQREHRTSRVENHVPPRAALAEALQYRSWSDVSGGQAVAITLEDWVPPPAGQRLLIATYSPTVARHIIQSKGLNGDNVKALRYPWQLTEADDVQRIVVLGDAYRLDKWNELVQWFECSTAQFVLLVA